LKKKSTPQPRERTRTLRQEILQHLGAAPLTTHQLSALVRIREKDVIPHLEHLQRSLRHSKSKLVVEPAECMDCGFRFEDRRRLTKPGGCPRCRSQRIEPPSFRLTGGVKIAP
jgi:predicted Zn-ribbon and HTH transcriptional regulator